MPFTMIRQDITRMDVDAIVNAANTQLLMGGGVCGAIFKAAGPAQLQAACDRLAPIQTGEAVITPGFALPARHIVHTAGPIYNQYVPQESERLLRSSYTRSMEVAYEEGCQSIAFPLISSGIYGYPKAEALRVAISSIRDFLADHDMDVYLVVFDRRSYTVSQDLLGAVDSYVDENYVNAHTQTRRVRLAADPDESNLPDAALDGASLSRAYGSADAVGAAPKDLHSFMPRFGMLHTGAPQDDAVRTGTSQTAPQASSHGDAYAVPHPAQSSSLEDLIGDLDEPFNTTLMRLIDVKGRTDVEVYKRANIDRKLFSKIRTGKGYTPSKRTILALAVALELTLEETDDLLERAGYALSHSQKADVIVEFFIINHRYDIYEINEVLFRYDQPLLGAG